MDQRGEPRIIAQAVKEVLVGRVVQQGGAVFIGLVEICEGAIFVAEASINHSESVSVAIVVRVALLEFSEYAHCVLAAARDCI